MPALRLPPVRVGDRRCARDREPGGIGRARTCRSAWPKAASGLSFGVNNMSGRYRMVRATDAALETGITGRGAQGSGRLAGSCNLESN
jgi:hypothetical protein